ncbi:hypothetical protein [Acholeplasma granularum]|uniref:hypothetical protein n=1 Tax=Acholeplasma granularum TaxID=264635 RepID=UPI0004BB9A09|nr:hypothetical protein [Acholeplasma granularum]
MMINNDMLKIEDVNNSILTRIKLVANMLCLNFAKEDFTSSLHIQCFYRIHKNNQVLVTSQDYHTFDYDNGDEDGTNNDLWKNIKKISNKIEGNQVTQVLMNDLKDIRLFLSNDFQIDILISNSKSNFEEMIEQYRFLPSVADNDHIVVYN